MLTGYNKPTGLSIPSATSALASPSWGVDLSFSTSATSASHMSSCFRCTSCTSLFEGLTCALEACQSASHSVGSLSSRESQCSTFCQAERKTIWNFHDETWHVFLQHFVIQKHENAQLRGLTFVSRTGFLHTHAKEGHSSMAAGDQHMDILDILHGKSLVHIGSNVVFLPPKNLEGPFPNSCFALQWMVVFYGRRALSSRYFGRYIFLIRICYDIPNTKHSDTSKVRSRVAWKELMSPCHI